SGVAQTKIPELPPDSRWRHWATSSKLVWSSFVRSTPMGLPVQWTIPFVHVQVSGAQFTLTKCSRSRECQPDSVPSIKALGGALDDCPSVWPATSRQRQPVIVPHNEGRKAAFMIWTV